MSLTLDGQPHAGRSSGSQRGLLGAGESNPSGMLEMPVLFRMPDVAEIRPPTVSPEILSNNRAAAESLPQPSAPSAIRSNATPIESQSAQAENDATEASNESTSPAIAEAANSAKSSKAVESWFDNHTKLLVICFLIALTAVVYLARQKRRSQSPLAAPTKPASEWPDEPSSDGAPTKPLSLVEPAAAPGSHAKEAPPAEATAALQLQGQVAPESPTPAANTENAATSAPIADDSALFPWKNSDGSVRTAARTVATPPQAPSTANANGGPPVVPLNIPSVSSPPASNNNLRGYQHERTGSGLY